MSYRNWKVVFVLIGLGIVTSSLPISGQSSALIYHPGDVIPITMTFEGSDANKVEKAAADFKTLEAGADQAGFSIDLYSEESAKDGPHTIKVSLKVPENQASGEYKLTMIRAFTSGAARAMVQYEAPNDFRPKTIRIDNSNKFVKPTIKNVEVGRATPPVAPCPACLAKNSTLQAPKL